MKTVAQTVIEADRFYTIAAHTGNVIQAVEGSKDGATVRLGKYDHKPEQEWSFVREGDGVYRIRNRASGKLLDLTMTGTANGTIAVGGTDVSVKGLGSAAYTESTAYDNAGAAAGVQTNLTTEIDRATKAETALGARIDEITECSEDDITALFTAK